jgi:uncharacterized repeat protein (TIGR01451 family)
LTLAFFFSFLLLSTTFTYAANPDGALRVEVVTAYNLVVDSNAGTPASYSPKSAYMGATFCNDGSAVLSNVVAYIGDYIDGVNDTPGVYPSRSHMTLVGPLPGGEFAFEHVGGSLGVRDATRQIGTLEPGECKTMYWLISYPLLDETGEPTWGPSVKPDDDLWLEYDVWAEAQTGASDLLAVETRTNYMRNEISASANKILPNGANKVPNEYLDLLGIYVPQWTNTPDDGSAGTRIILEGIWYDLGNVGDGFDNNGDLVPDKNAWMQPVGDPSLFDPSCFRLSHTYAMVIVKLKGGGEVVYSVEDQLYFENIPENVGAVGWVGYEFTTLKGGCGSQLTPYQEVASGFDNEKFNADFGATLGEGLHSPSSRVAMAKTVDRAFAPPGTTLTYRVSYTNAGEQTVGAPDQGLPLSVQDSIPEGTYYIGGSATASNVLPSGVTSYTVLYSTNNKASWLTVEPAIASNVTDIQWWLSDPLVPAEAGTVSFQVGIFEPFTNAVPWIYNKAGLALDSADPFLEDDATTLVQGENSIGDTVFVDDGSGGGLFGNQIQDGAEPWLSNITVSLYYDLGGDGQVDAGDIFIGTNVTDVSGQYLFTNLVDGYYVAVVDVYDPDIPTGYGNTMPITVAVDLDSGNASSAPVSYLDADFAFAPVLGLDKELPSGLNTREGDIVTYSITVTNRLRGNGSGVGGGCRFTVWAEDRDAAAKPWLTPYNAHIPPGPDGQYASNTLEAADELLTLHTLNAGSVNGAVTNVKVVLPTFTTGTFTGGDNIDVELYIRGAAAYYTTNIPANQINSRLQNGAIVLDVTSYRTWAVSDFNGTNHIIQIVANKGGGPEDGTIYVDAAGFIFETDEICGAGEPSSTLDPVPVVDTYDADLLKFVSAYPFPVSHETNGAAPNTEGRIEWDNVGPLYPGGASTIDLTFEVLEPPNNSLAIFTNVATVTNAYFVDGRPSNNDTDKVVALTYPAGLIGDFVWRDLNADGVQDGGDETGIANVSVVLTPPAAVDLGNGAGNPITNITDATGYYYFDGIPADGTYTVTVQTATLPGGVGSPTWDADGGNDNTTAVYIDHDASDGSDTSLINDFGYQVQSSIEGTVWHDFNRNGTNAPDAGEEWIEGVEVYLCANPTPCGPGTSIATNTTDANGYFQFVGNYTGTYTVLVYTNAGTLANGDWTQSFDTDGLASTNYVTVNVVSGGTARADYSYYKTGNYAIGDTLFYDWDGDGIQDASDEGIADITVSLYEDADGDGVIDFGTDAFIASQVTSSTGTYLFANVVSSNYIVLVNESDPDFPDNYSMTYDPYGALDGLSLAIVTNTDRLDQDFGYTALGNGSIGDTVWYDQDADGTQNGLGEVGLSNITVSLWADLNGDGTYSAITSVVTGTDGYYLFDNLPDGDYRVDVDATDADLPADAFGNTYYATTSTSYTYTVTGGSSYLDADFGFTALGAVGDTIYWDANENGSQDWNEIGISNVTVELYYDENGDGFYDVGDTFVDSRSTDSNGVYLFTGVATGDYVVLVVETGVLATVTISADPDSDGVPCSQLATNTCDGETDVTLIPGQNFMGADFGYIPPGVIGDTIWIDTDNDGVRDATESGIPYIDVTLYTNGTAVQTVETDADGYYIFSDLPDGDYRVVVNTADSDFPAGLGQVYGPDDTLDDQATNINISGGTVTNIGGTGCTSCSLDVDFGYRFTGTNSLSGTVGLDDPTYDGVMGSGASGVATNEAPFVGKTVYLYLWNDDGDNVPESSERILVNQTQTSTNGDYGFTGLPSGDGDDQYIISMAAPDDYLTLTTTDGSGTSTNVVETTDLQGYNVSTYQTVPILPLTENVDFAYKSLFRYDFGDLPQTYGTLFEGIPSGARHVVLDSTNLYLGATVDTEVNGAPSADAEGDGADEDGVLPIGIWQEGTNGGAVRVTVGDGDGWLVGFVDFDNDGDFSDFYDLIFSMPVSSTGGDGNGVYTNYFFVPDGAISVTNNTTLYGRFRLFEEEPPFDKLAYYGRADNGEVEDYYWLLGTLGDLVWEDVNGNGTNDPGEPLLEGIRVFIDENADGQYTVGEPTSITDSNGIYGIGGFSTGTYAVVVDTNSFSEPLIPIYDLDGTNTPHSIDTTITNGLVRFDLDYGYWRYGAVGDYVWDDLDNDGVQDAGEPGVSNVTVRLYDAVTNLVDTTLTDSSGYYLFTGLYPGDDYYVEFIAPPFVLLGSQDQGGDDTLDSDADSVTGFTDAFSVNSGETNTTIDAALLITAVGIADVGVTKTVDDPIPEEGDSVAYTLVATNVGPDVASSVVFTDAVPAGVTYVSSSSPDYSVASNLWWIGTMPVGATTSLTLNVTVDAGTFGQVITNLVVLSDMDQLDSNTNNNRDTAIITVNGVDIGITKTASDATPNEGETFSYSLVATNTTYNDASGVVFTDSLPAGVTFVSSSSGDYDDSTGLWTVGNLAAYGSTTLTINVTVDALTGGTTITNCVALSSVTQKDINNLNNADCAEITVPLVDIGVVKEVDSPTAYEGDALVYTLVVSNAGPDDATSVVVTDALPAGVTYVSDSSVDYTVPGNAWAVGSLPAGASTSMTVNITVDAGTAGSWITNILEVSSLDQSDHNPTNDTDDAVFNVLQFNSVGDYVWFDANSNYVQDVGESGFTNVTVNLYDGNSNLLDSTLTDASGAYLFTNLEEGTYFIGFVQPPDYVFVPVDTGGDDTIDSDANKNTGYTELFTLTGGTNDLKWDAGLRLAEFGLTISKSSSLGGTCWTRGVTNTYTLSVANTGEVTHTLTTITDPLPSGVLYVTNSTKVVAPETVTNTVRDEFETVAYTNSDGTLQWPFDWTQDWIETGDGDGPTVGDLAVTTEGTNKVLKVSGRNNIITRCANLTGQDYAIWSFDFKKAGLGSPQDAIYAEVSSDGSAWTTLATYQGASASYASTNYDITSYIGTNTCIRFRTADKSQMDNTDILYVDNINIEIARRGIYTNAGYAPPTVSMDQTLYTGETMTVTFDVVMDPSMFVTQVVNTAWLYSLTQPPVPASVTDCVSYTDLGVTKSPNKTELYGTNELVWFTVVVTNNGPENATQVRLEDDWPGNVTFLSAEPSTGSYDGVSHAWSFDYLAVGDSCSLVITGRVNASAETYITNTITITGMDQFDSNPENNTDDASIATLVVISRVSAYLIDGKVVVEWETVSEVETIGFYLYRDDPAEGWVPVNSELLPGLLTSPEGGRYQVIDADASPQGVHVYKLIEVEASGTRRSYGPFELTVSPLRRKSARGARVSVDRDTQRAKHCLLEGFWQERRERGFDSDLRRTLWDTASDRYWTMRRTTTGSLVKLPVKADGMYYVAASDIAEWLDLPMWYTRLMVATRFLVLKSGGERVRYLPAEGGAGLYFYGKGVDSIYTDENIYWLGWGYSPAVGEEDGGSPAARLNGATFRDTLAQEKDVWPSVALFDDPEGDFWLWDYIIAGNAYMGDREFQWTVNGVGDSSTEAEVTVALQGSSTTDSPWDHRARIRLNGVEIGSTDWKDTDAHTVTLSCSQELLLDGTNTLRIEGEKLPDVPFSVFAIDSFSLTYQRLYQAVNDLLAFRGDGHSVVTVRGFSNSNIVVLNVTDPKQPLRVVEPRIESDGGGLYRVSFRPSGPEQRYVAFTADGPTRITEALPALTTDLTWSDNRGDYVIVTRGALLEGAEALAAYRADGGWQPRIVLLEEIYDVFNYGVADPAAIKAFLAHAYTYWSVPPECVVFLGKGTYDYKDLQGQGDNVVPVRLIKTEQGLFAADNWYADVWGDDGIPELVVGRIPALNNDEVVRYVNKVARREADFGEWWWRVLLAADDKDIGGDFPDDSERIGGLVGSGFDVRKTYLSDYSASAARSRLIRDVNDGALLLNYIGHGGLDRFATEGLLRVSDVNALTNSVRQPVVLGLTCVVGRHELPGTECLAERLVMDEDGGSVAVWAASGMSENKSAVKLDEEFMRAVFEDGERELYRAIQKSFEAYADRDRRWYMVQIYNLLGDPAIRLDAPYIPEDELSPPNPIFEE